MYKTIPQILGIPVCSPDGQINMSVAQYCTVESIRYEAESLDYIAQVRMRVPMNLHIDDINPRSNNFGKTTALGEKKMQTISNVKTAKQTHRDRSLVDHVLFNSPATVIFWKDKTKTVVKQQPGDTYDAEKGFMAAYLKKMLGNDNQYNWEIKHFVPKQEVNE